MVMSQNDKFYNNKVVLITGAARRVGAEIAQHFHRLGANIIIHCCNSINQANELAANFNNIRLNSAKVINCDLSSLVEPGFIENLTGQIVNSFGRLDVLVNNASSFFPTKFGEIDLKAWRDLMVSNAGGPFFLAQALAPYLAKTSGCIINISDIHAVRPLKNYSVYSIAKAANDMVTKSLARELAPSVRVNAVAPGPILWPENTNELDDITKDKILSRTLLKKTGSPQDIAQAVAFLSSAPYITGQILAVDGGRSIKD